MIMTLTDAIRLVRGRKGFALVITAIVALSAFGAPAFAQDASKKKKESSEAFNPWIKLCSVKTKKLPKVCVTRIDGLGGSNLVPYAPIALEQIDGIGDSLIVTFPHVWLVPVEFKDPKTKKPLKSVRFIGARWAIKMGVFIKIDKNKIHKFSYVYCDQASCVAQTKATKELMAELKKGKKIIVVAMNSKKQMPRAFPLKGFGKALAGKPSDGKSWQKRIAGVRKQQILLVQKFQKAEMAAIKKRKEAQKKK
ncbi:MAG: hypothetical protein GY927_01675 [bacterium]|nr:hypothetical protein [bacterium]